MMELTQEWICQLRLPLNVQSLYHLHSCKEFGFLNWGSFGCYRHMSVHNHSYYHLSSQNNKNGYIDQNIYLIFLKNPQLSKTPIHQIHHHIFYGINQYNIPNFLKQKAKTIFSSSASLLKIFTKFIYIHIANMICTFIVLNIINFTKMSSQMRKLSEEEANLLFESTFLAMAQQNITEKQKNMKNKYRALPNSLLQDLQPQGKKSSTQDHPPSEELCPLFSVMDPQKTTEKVMQDTCHKFSTDKQESYNEGHSLSPNSPLKLSEKEWNSDPLQIKSTSSPMKQYQSAEQMQSFSPMAHSQIRQESSTHYFVQRQIKEIKRDLEILSRGKICKSQEINSKTGQVTGYIFYCKNDNNCPFDCALQYTGDRNPRNEKIYKLIINCQKHVKTCLQDDEEITFMKLTKIIDGMERYIMDLLSQNAELKPKDILIIFASRNGEEDHKFIYKGLKSKNYHKAAKKYFDNLIYKIKSQMGAL